MSGTDTLPGTETTGAETLAVRCHKRNWTPYLLSLPLIVIALVIFIYPIIHMAVTTLIVTNPTTGAVSIDWAPFNRIMMDSYAQDIVYRTIRVSLLTTLLTLVLAYPVTLWMRQLSPRWRGILVVILLSPLLMSVVVRTLGWVVLLGPGGFIDDTLSKIGLGPLKLLYTEPAMIFGLAHVFLGFMVLAMMTSVLKVPDNVIAAGYNLGATAWQVLWHIVFPLTRPGVFAGAVIVFPLAASAYVTPALLGGSKNPVMATEVYGQAIVQLEFSRAAAMSLALFLIICVVIVALSLAMRNKKGQVA